MPEGRIGILVAKPCCRPAAGTALERRQPREGRFTEPLLFLADPITGFQDYRNQTMFCALQSDRSAGRHCGSPDNIIAGGSPDGGVVTHSRLLLHAITWHIHAGHSGRFQRVGKSGR